MKILAWLHLIVLLLLPANALAHSAQELSDRLTGSEKFFQAVNRPAPDFELLDADANTVSLQDFRGKVLVLYFIYTDCPDICPLQTEYIAALQETINQTPMRDLVAFVTITTDPKNDSFQVMQNFGDERGLDPENWQFLTSGPDRLAATRELVEQFGHSFTPTGDGYQVHGTVTHVIDQQGQWRGNFHGLNFERTSLLFFINALTNERHRDGEDQTPGLWQRIRSVFP